MTHFEREKSTHGLEKQIKEKHGEEKLSWFVVLCTSFLVV
jgi:hypothetical protein